MGSGLGRSGGATGGAEKPVGGLGLMTTPPIFIAWSMAAAVVAICGSQGSGTYSTSLYGSGRSGRESDSTPSVSQPW